MDTDHAIEATGLHKVYRTRFRGREIRAVSDLTLRVPVGVKFGLLGPNGAGKTTFVKMLLSAVNPDQWLGGAVRARRARSRSSEADRVLAGEPSFPDLSHR